MGAKQPLSSCSPSSTSPKAGSLHAGSATPRRGRARGRVPLPSPRSCQQQPLEQGLVDCSLSITAQIISILHSALCTVLGKSNTLKG